MLATLHLPVDLYPASALNGGVQLNCVSQSQANSLPSGSRCAVVENGIDIEQYTLGSGKRGYLLWLGRICPEKGVHIALRVAHRLALPMVVAGPVHPFRDHQEYFAKKVRPLLDDKRRYIGPVDIQEKPQLLSKAVCLLLPSLIAETSSLVAMEAITSGTPVVAYRSGALPEVVEHGVTGFIVDSEEEMARGVESAAALSSEVCRSRALERFDCRHMVAAYLELYGRVIDGFTSTRHA
jgi:glycosyltransferase involved in cell wall biosynthesis